MPTPPNVPSVCRFRLLGTLANAAPWGVRFYTLFSGGSPSNANMLTLAEGVAAAWNDTCGQHQSHNVTTTACDGIDLTTDSGAAATADVDYPGGADEAPVDNQVAGIVKYIIARRYRGGKPKMYIPGLGISGVLDNSHWTTSFADAMGTAFTDFDSAISLLSAGSTDLQEIVNVSFYKGFTPSQNPVTLRWRNIPTYRSEVIIDPVGAFTFDELFGSQKRRRVG